MIGRGIGIPFRHVHGTESEISFDKSLVDAWFMSGYSNDNPPASISGYKGHELVLKNFAFTSNSGFGGSVDHSGGNDEGKAASSYEGSLVFDGVDDYAICEGLLPLDDFTVICRRTFTKESISSKRNTGNNTGAFVADGIFSSGKNVRSYGTNNIVSFDTTDSITYMTPTNYNGKTITRGTWKDSDFLLLGGAYRNNEKQVFGFMEGAIYYFALYDKSLTPDEIEQEKIKLNEIWTKRLNG